MQHKFEKYLYAAIQRIEKQSKHTLDISELHNFIFGAGAPIYRIVSRELGNYLPVSLIVPDYHLQSFQNKDRSMIGFSITPINLYYDIRSDFNTEQRIGGLESEVMYFFKIDFKREILIYEEQSFKRSTTRDGKPYKQRTLFKKLSVRNGHHLFTWKRPQRSKTGRRYSRLQFNYFSFKNLQILDRLIGKHFILVGFPGADRPWTQQILNQGLNWNVSFKEYQTIESYRDFLQVHFSNNNSPLTVTNRMCHYPQHILQQLSQISNTKAARTLQLFFTTLPMRAFLTTDKIYELYFRHRLSLPIASYLDQTLSDYLDMCVQQKIIPNLGIRSTKRLEHEHNNLFRQIKSDSVKDFQVAPLHGLLTQKDGYFFKQITDKDALLNEGADMHHCVISYADKVQNGRSVIISISGHERATLELVPRPSIDFAYQFDIRQLKGKFNRSTSKDLERVCVDLVNRLNASAPALRAGATGRVIEEFEEDTPF